MSSTLEVHPLPAPRGKVVPRPDGDLTIAGTNVWLPSDERELARELDWTVQRAAELLAAMDYLSAYAPRPL